MKVLLSAQILIKYLLFIRPILGDEWGHRGEQVPAVMEFTSSGWETEANKLSI